MALAKDRLGSVQTCAYNRISIAPYGSFDDEKNNKKLVLDQEGETIMNTNNLAVSHSSSSLGSPSSANSNEFFFHSSTNNNSNQAEEVHSLINFCGGFDNFMRTDGSLLSFEQNNNKVISSHKNDYSSSSTWEGNLINCNNNNYQWNSDLNPRLLEDINCFQTASNFNSMANSEKEYHGDWLYSEGNTSMVTDSIQESGAVQEVNFHKRPHLGQSMLALKKQCNSATRKPKPKSSPSKDPQSIAAKNRRERISERLKILQELVPNGSKVDLVTMLEKAISYVKFLQLQVKVLATDEFWPVQGGKAPDISQVKEAIDAILSSSKDRNSSSSSK